MANREALRELQTRLATRLQAARSEGASVAWLAVKAGTGNYLLPLAQSGEIFPLSGLQPVPYSQKWFLGVLNIRGGLYGVVSLSGFVTQQEDRDTVVDSPGGMDASVVTINPLLEINCALKVDSLSGLRGPDAFTASAEPSDGAPAYFGNSFVDTDGIRWQEINLRILSQYPQFLSISA